ncbi:MAG: sugar kinase [Candidatus Latescibacterota bacterium]|nr:MAG: sugar kinase [Candidatus Latescibacterota bacterium]
MMTDRSVDVFGLGQCCIDYLTTVDRFPAPDSKCEFSNLSIEGGGPVATAMVALSRWGLSCAVAGVVGDDGFGSMITRSLIDERVDTHNLLVRKGGCSQFAFITAEPGTGRRTVFWRRPTGDALRPDEVDLAAVRRAGLFYTDGLMTNASLAAAREARKAGVPVVVDAGTLRDGMIDLARTSDVFLASETFARQLAGDDPPVAACRQIASLGPRVSGVTLGHRGYVAMDGDTVIERPAHKADTVDTTGCGDVFHAGVAYGVVAGWDVAKSLDFGAWAAAMVSKKLGGRRGIPKKENYPNW